VRAERTRKHDNERTPAHGAAAETVAGSMPVRRLCAPYKLNPGYNYDNYSIDLTMPSVIFLASPNNIMVLSR
jgi:hypothetical protein